MTFRIMDLHTRRLCDVTFVERESADTMCDLLNDDVSAERFAVTPEEA